MMVVSLFCYPMIVRCLIGLMVEADYPLAVGGLIVEADYPLAVGSLQGTPTYVPQKSL